LTCSWVMPLGISVSPRSAPCPGLDVLAISDDYHQYVPYFVIYITYYEA
jgi:hypothetical protein